MSDAKWMSIPSGLKVFYSNDLFGSSSLPAKIFLVFFKQDRLNGDFEKSIQYYEKPANLISCGLELDSKPIGDFLTCTTRSYPTGLLNFQYLNIFLTGQNYYTTNNGPNVALETFNSRQFILCYDLTASGFCSENSFPLIKTGSLRLHVEFSAATTEPLTCLLFSTAPATLTIDQNRQVAISYRA